MISDHEIQSCYWKHWELFPHNRDVPQEILEELEGILIHAGIGRFVLSRFLALLQLHPQDSMTSSVSTSLYSEEGINKLLGFIKSLGSVGGNFGYAACVTGQLVNCNNSRLTNV
jgi:hypothetical protein